jgi:prolyl-tRNA synthetase
MTQLNLSTEKHIMSQKPKTAIVPTRAENYPEWYQQVIKAADLAEASPTRGCMVIKPWGYSIWENIQRNLDHQLKAAGAKNAYFPLLIPIHFFEKEAEHIQGFAKECAVVTHSRLVTNEEGKLVPSSPLEEPYIIRPTSETIIGEAFSRWVQSYRDLPLIINQWANVMRWEMRTRMFLRTSEFLWQEGHTAHATEAEARNLALTILDLYTKFSEDYLAMPVFKGEKTASERFPGAVNTYCIEAMMQDKKALQAGTSHFLGQNFAKACNIKYLSAKGQEELVHTTSWGVTTRLIGGVIMTHSDDNGFVMPPKIAAVHVVILPIVQKEEHRAKILAYCEQLRLAIQKQKYNSESVKAEIDQRDLNNGEKSWSWVKKGVPFRVEVGMRECETETVYVGRRDREYKAKQNQSRNEFVATLGTQLEDLHFTLLKRAREFRDTNTVTINSKAEFYSFFKENEGGFVRAHWNGSEDVEAQIKSDLNVTIRCIPMEDQSPEKGQCIFTGDPSSQRVIFAKSY